MKVMADQNRGSSLLFSLLRSSCTTTCLLREYQNRLEMGRRCCLEQAFPVVSGLACPGGEKVPPARARAALCPPYHGSSCSADMDGALALGRILFSLEVLPQSQQEEADVNHVLLKLKQEHITSGNSP